MYFNSGYICLAAYHIWNFFNKIFRSLIVQLPEKAMGCMKAPALPFSLECWASTY